jgi:flagellar biosynthesis/type III secretory pathway protein FliH
LKGLDTSNKNKETSHAEGYAEGYGSAYEKGYKEGLKAIKSNDDLKKKALKSQLSQ